MNLPLPLLATQILWINIISDGLPNLAIAVEPEEEGIMDRKPKKRTEPILNRGVKMLILAGVFADLFVLGFFFLIINYYSIEYTRTLVFAIVGVDSLLYAFSVRSLHHSIFSKNILSNKYLIGSVLISFLVLLAVLYVPFLQGVFHTVSIGLSGWLFIIGFSVFKIILIEITKYFFFIKKKFTN